MSANLYSLCCIYNLDETMFYVRNPVLCRRLGLQQGIQEHIHNAQEERFSVDFHCTVVLWKHFAFNVVFLLKRPVDNRYDVNACWAELTDT